MYSSLRSSGLTLLAGIFRGAQGTHQLRVDREVDDFDLQDLFDGGRSA